MKCSCISSSVTALSSSVKAFSIILLSSANLLPYSPIKSPKKISLDRVDEKKWSLRIGYNYFMPDSKYLTMFQNKLKIGGAYDFNKNVQLQAFLSYADGKKSFDIDGVSTR